jgi:membrane protein XagC
MNRTMTLTLRATPIASFAFVVILVLLASAVSHGLLTDDALRLWAGASTAADGQVPIGRIVAAYPTLPFLSTTLVAWLAPATPAPALVAACLFALITVFCFLSFRQAGLPMAAAAVFTVLIAFHPALLRAVVAGPSDMFLAAFLLMLCLALYSLRARSGTSEVMGVGLALMALAFSHPMGAAFAFAAIPFLAFAVRPLLVASSAFNIVIALTFPVLFAVGAFSYVSWIFPGDGWSLFAAPTESLSLWTAAIVQVFGDDPAGFLTLYASLAMTAALVVATPVTVVMLALVYRRRLLVIPAVIFAAVAIAATAISILSGLFGDPAALVVAAPVLAAAVVIRVPLTRERLGLTTALLMLGWFGGIASLTLVDPITVHYFHVAFAHGEGERLDALTAGGAAVGRDGVLADVDNAPAFVLGRGRARGILGPQSEPFALAMLFARINTPFVAVPDPQSNTGANDRLNKAFPSFFREGAPGYSIIYQNNTWRLFARTKHSLYLND